jgi:hypothetical protein
MKIPEQIKSHAAPVTVGAGFLALVSGDKHPVMDFIVRDFDKHPRAALTIFGGLVVVLLYYIRSLKKSIE